MRKISETLGELVKEGRIEHNLTQGEFAERIGKSERTVIKIEQGIGNPKLDTLGCIVDVLKLTPDALFYPENDQDCPMLERLRHEIAGCTEDEAAALIPIVRSVLSALRDESRIDL